MSTHTRSRLITLAALGVVLTGALTGCASATERVSRSGVAPDPSSSGSCVAGPDAELARIDEDDSPEALWPHRPGQETVVYFELGELTERYAGFVRRGAELWSRSPCIDARAVDHCPADTNCSQARLRERSRDPDTDGESEGKDRDGVRRGNMLTFYTGPLDVTSDNGALATVVHEMGHALGLVHRADKGDVMSAVTGERTDPVPDEVDLANLQVLYGRADESPDN